jgi:pimeloyl-ACP methyl ester carboxylesterase
MATPLHFGDSARPLYGVYHAPSARAGKRPAVLLFNPFGEEAIRAFRIYRLLGEKLSQGGASVLRFDYFATGDSAGECAEASLAGFAASARVAHEELLDMSGARDAVWVGLRLGAAVALGAAGESREPPSRIILWDPVVSGAAYLDELAAGHRAAISAQIGAAPDPARARSEALGFAIPEALARALADLDLRAVTTRPARRVVVIAGFDPPTDRALEETLNAAGAETRWCAPPDEVSWNSDQALNSFVVPARTLDLIVAEALA